MKSEEQDPKQVQISVKLYRILLAFYPSRFREEFGSQMVQVFRDHNLRVFQKNQSSGLFGFWLHILVDFFMSVVEQYANRGAVMTRSSWIQLSGWLMALSGVFYIVGWLASTRPEFNEYNFYSLPIDRY